MSESNIVKTDKAKKQPITNFLGVRITLLTSNVKVDHLFLVFLPRRQPFKAYNLISPEAQIGDSEFLLDQNKLSRFLEIIHLKLVKVNPACHLLSLIVFAVPGNSIIT